MRSTGSKGIEIEDPELVEVAEDRVGGAVWDDELPVFEELVVVLFEVRAALLHLDEDAARPEEVGELLAVLSARGGLAFDELELRGAGLLRDAEFQRGAGFLHAAVAQRAEELIKKELRLAFLVALQRAGEGRELCEGCLKFGRGHGRDMTNARRGWRGCGDFFEWAARLRALRL